jgi:protein LSM14
VFRYEGTLVKIDSETATVSLQDVQCHGTEGRKGNANEEIPGSDSVYDGIVFRGSDVKDLTIVAPPKENRPPQQQMPNDPAILSVRMLSVYLHTTSLPLPDEIFWM